MTKCQCGRPPAYLSDKCSRCCSVAALALAMLYGLADEAGRRRIEYVLGEARRRKGP